MNSEFSTNISEALHGGDVYRNEVRLDFSVNLNPFDMPQAVLDAIQTGLAEIHQYPDPKQQKLREGIAALEAPSFGEGGAGTENVVCGNGASELIMAAVHAVMPKKALITAPCYAGYAVALKAADTEITEYPLKESLGFALDEEFLGYITEDTGMVFITDPNNPNGKLIRPDLKKAIAAKCEECGVVLVIDECFYPLTDAGLAARQGGSVIADKALHLRAFTKTFAIPGIRTGYLLSRDTALLEKIRKHLPEWNVSRIAERTGEAAAKVLAETDYLEKSVGMISQERSYLTEQLSGLGIKVYPGDTNYLLIRSVPDLYSRLLAKGIMIRRCANFSGLDDTYFRIAVRRHTDNEELVMTLGSIF